MSDTIPIFKFPNSDHAARVVAHMESEIGRLERNRRSLQLISGQQGDVVLNFSRDTYRGIRNGEPADNLRSDAVDMFADGLERHGFRLGDAYAEAKQDVEDYDTPDCPQNGYVTTIALHPDGTWTEEYLFPL